MSAAITVSDLVKRYGGRAVVDELSFEVEEGELFALLGPNGAGKTTTIEILEGFRRQDAGGALVLGCDPRRSRRALAARVGVMPQDGGLYAGIRPPEALRQFASFYPSPLDPDELLDRVGLRDAARTPFRRLSTGERQRLSLALAIVGRPEVAFLDEPTSGMDVHARARTWEVIRELGMTVLLTTHLIDEAERLADRVAIVHRGRLVAIGPPASLGGPREVSFRAAPGLDLAGLDLPVTEDAPGSYRVGADPTPELIARLTSWLARRDVELRGLETGRSLEDVFVELTRPGVRGAGASEAGEPPGRDE